MNDDHNTSPQNILLVDDDTGLLRVLEITFQRAGYVVSTATTGEQALDAVARQRPDAILLDDMMPGTSGTQICRRLKADPDTRGILIIMYSAGPDIMNRAMIEAIGADMAIRKPSVPRDLVAAVDRLLTAHA